MELGADNVDSVALASAVLLCAAVVASHGVTEAAGDVPAISAAVGVPAALDVAARNLPGSAGGSQEFLEAAAAFRRKTRVFI